MAKRKHRILVDRFSPAAHCGEDGKIHMSGLMSGRINEKAFNVHALSFEAPTIFADATQGEKSAITQLFNRVRKGKRVVCHLASRKNGMMPICQLGMLMEVRGVTCDHTSLPTAAKDLKKAGHGFTVVIGPCRKQ